MVNTLQFSLYGVFFISSFILSFAFVAVALRIKKIPWNIIGYSTMLNTIIILFGARCYGVIASGFRKNVLNSGFSSLGAAIGLLLGTFIMTIIYDKGKKEIWEAHICALPLLYGISKLGCFTSGCCAGIEYHGPFSITYDNFYGKKGPLFPVQLAESLVFITIFVIALLLYFKWRSAQLISYMLILCALGKFSLDFLRQEHVGKILSSNQIVCMIFFVVGIVRIFLENKDRKQLV